MNKFLFALALGLAALLGSSARAEQVLKDPESGIHYALLSTGAPVVVGWGFESWVVEEAQVDFTRLLRDESYGDELFKKYEDNLVQVVAEASTGRVLATFSASELGRVCYQTEYASANHCEVDFFLESNVGVLVTNMKWATSSVLLFKFGKGEQGLEIAGQSDNLVSILDNDFLLALDAEHAQNQAYLRDRDGLASIFRVTGLVQEGSTLRLEFGADASVPKGMEDDSFVVEDQRLGYLVNLSRSRLLLKRN